MKLFECPSCGNAIHFENTTCVSCGRRLGYAPDIQAMTSVEPVEDVLGDRQVFAALGAGRRLYRFCDNAGRGVCNWLVDVDDDQTLCRSCRHNRLAPDLAVAGNLARWARVEQAKRHLFYSLLLWGLPTPAVGAQAREPLAFDLVGDVQTSQGVQRVLTGHEEGQITLNIAEADDDEREKRRVAMGEPYRTLLGHFRHEIGHYYWDLLVRDGGKLDAFRATFGDERADYGRALQSYYANGAPPDWPDHHISAYATSHPWEDFAETWAHYMHIVDTLETAGSFGISLKPRHVDDGNLQIEVGFDAYSSESIEEILTTWTPISVAINSLNRSLGQADPYPFVLSPTVIGKFDFVHRLIHERAADELGKEGQSALHDDIGQERADMGLQ